MKYIIPVLAVAFLIAVTGCTSVTTNDHVYVDAKGATVHLCVDLKGEEQ